MSDAADPILPSREGAAGWLRLNRRAVRKLLDEAAALPGRREAIPHGR